MDYRREEIVNKCAIFLTTATAYCCLRSVTSKLIFMKTFALFPIVLSLFVISSTTEPMRIDFGNKQDGQDWRPLLDGVMGGLSQGRMTLNNNSLSFSGSVSLANNGGFSSMRSPFSAVDLSAYETLVIRARGEGQSFAIVLENDRRWYNPYFKKAFQPTEEWQTFEIPLAEFDLYQIGRKIGSVPTEEALAATIRLGIVTNDKKEGPFSLEVDFMEFR